MAMSSKDNSGMMTGLFHGRDDAERAYQELSKRGYTNDDINVAMSDDTRKKYFSQGSDVTTEIGNKAAEGAGIGGAIGGTVGATLAAISAAGTSLVLPGLGLIVAGPLAAAMAGAGAGAATGGLIGALVGWGIPEERIKHYEKGLKDGGILIGVKPKSEAEASRLAKSWHDNNGQHIYRPENASYGDDNLSGHTIAAVYDNYSDAESAVRAIVAAGFPLSSVQLDPESDSAAPQQVTPPDTDRPRRSSGVGGFFRSVFGHGEYKDYGDAYAESVRRGSYVLTVYAKNEEEVDRAAEIMNRFQAVDIDERRNHWRSQGSSGVDTNAPQYSHDEIKKERHDFAQVHSGSTSETSRIPVIEEEMNVGKREVQRGGVRVFRHLLETPVHESVNLTQEHVKVERHRTDKPATEADLAAFKEGTIELREMSEEAVVSKTARVVEEVVVEKEVSQRTEEINDTVRRTDVEVKQLDSTDSTAASADSADSAHDDSDFRRHWQATYGTSGSRYEDYDAAYRYGSTMANDDRYQHGQWEEVEPQMRNDWESNYPESTWERFREAVRYGAQQKLSRERHR